MATDLPPEQWPVRPFDPDCLESVNWRENPDAFCICAMMRRESQSWDPEQPNWDEVWAILAKYVNADGRTLPDERSLTLSRMFQLYAACCGRESGESQSTNQVVMSGLPEDKPDDSMGAVSAIMQHYTDDRGNPVVWLAFTLASLSEALWPAEIDSFCRYVLQRAAARRDGSPLPRSLESNLSKALGVRVSWCDRAADAIRDGGAVGLDQAQRSGDVKASHLLMDSVADARIVFGALKNAIDDPDMSSIDPGLGPDALRTLSQSLSEAVRTLRAAALMRQPASSANGPRPENIAARFEKLGEDFPDMTLERKCYDSGMATFQLRHDMSLRGPERYRRLAAELAGIGGGSDADLHKCVWSIVERHASEAICAGDPGVIQGVATASDGEQSEVVIIVQVIRDVAGAVASALRRRDIQAGTDGLDAPPTDRAILEKMDRLLHIAESRQAGGSDENDETDARGAELPPLKPHDRQAWQLSILHGSTQSQVAEALNREHGTKYTQGQISRMIGRAKRHAEASGLAEKVNEISGGGTGGVRVMDPGRLDLGQRTDKRRPRPSDLERSKDDD